MLKEIARVAGIDEKTLTSEQPGILLIQSGNISTDTLMANEGKPDHYRYYDIQKMTDLEPGDTFQMQLLLNDPGRGEGSFPDGCGLSYERRDRPLAFGEEQFLCEIVSSSTREKIEELMEGRGFEPECHLQLKNTGGN